LVFLAPYNGSGFINDPNVPGSEGTLTVWGINGLGIDNQVSQQINLTRRLLINGNQEWRISSATGSIAQLTLAGSINSGLNLGSSILTLNAVNAANSFTFSNPLSGAGGITVMGAGSVNLNAINSYTGATTINSGTLALAGTGSIATSSTVIVNGTLDVSGIAAAGTFINSLAGADTGVIHLGAKDMTIANAAGDFAGVIDGVGGLTLNGIQTLSGNNTYTGVTTISAGTLQLGNGGTAGSVSGDITNNGALVFNRANQFTLAGVISGTGDIRQIGSGTTTLTGNNSAFSGASYIDAGTLSVNGTLGGSMEVRGGRLQGTGTVGDTTNFAGGTIAPGNSIGTLLIAGNYTGNGGTLEIEGQFAGTGSSADRLLISGNASGSTVIKTINLGGAGAITGSGNTDGISIIQVAGTSAANTFQLAGGYAAAGPYQYRLRAFDSTGSAIGELDPRLGAAPSFYDYRLQSVVDASGKPVAVPQIAGYQALPTGAVRYGASLLDSVHKRLGELRQLAATRDKNGGQQNAEFFMRAQGSTNDVSGNRASGYDQNIGYVQAGGNVFGKDLDDGAKVRVGGAISFGDSNLSADQTNAKVNLHGTTVALTTTYQAAAGWYLDGVMQLTKYTSDIRTDERGQTASPNGRGVGISLEGGYPFDLAGGLVIEPQVQLSYQKIKFNTFTDVDQIAVDLKDGESLRGRFGGRIQQIFDKNTDRSWLPFIEANLIHEFLSDGSINASGVEFASDSIGTSLQLGGGINAQVGANKIVFASVSYEKGLSSAAADAWSGNIGMRIDF
jgi:fibronectin-binding autotransporter adhesin